MNGIEITTTLTQADWRAYQMAWSQRMQATSRGRSRVWSFALLLVAVAVVAVALATLTAQSGERMSFVSFIAGVALSFGTTIYLQRRMQAHARPDEDGMLLGRGSVSFLPEGIRIRKQGARVDYAWHVVQDTTLTTEHLFVWIDRVAALIVPLRDFPLGRDPRAVVAEIQAMAAAADGRETVAPPAPTGATEEVAPTLTARPQTKLQEFVRAAARVLTLRTADPNALVIDDRTAAAILVGALGMLIGIDWLLAEPGSQFYPYGLLVCSWYALATLIGAWLASRLSEPSVEFRRLVVIAIALTPIAVAVQLLSTWLGERLRVPLLVLTALYALLVLERSLRSMTLRGQPRALAAGLLVVCMTVWASERSYFGAHFWYPSYDEYEEGDAADAGAKFLEQWRATEKTLFEQAERIRASVEKMDRPDTLDAAAFFVGFAGMGEQRVFAGEIALADQVIATKFGTAARGIRLVNDRRDLNAYPLASPTALRYTLNSLAQKMNLERDVLFLALASHGSDDAFISVSNSSLPLNDLTAVDLADALRAAGIKWRVIIVSACYAGSFIEPLRDDHTIVITAAAADRTSFGCADDRDATYFGEAFYRDALPAAANLRDAFETAKRLVTERETSAGVTASDPQAHFGPALELLLAEQFPPRPADNEVAASPQL